MDDEEDESEEEEEEERKDGGGARDVLAGRCGAFTYSFFLSTRGYSLFILPFASRCQSFVFSSQYLTMDGARTSLAYPRPHSRPLVTTTDVRICGSHAWQDGF